MSVKAIAVTAKASGMCTANIAGNETVIFVARDLTVAIGDGLLVEKNASGEWWAFARYGTGVIPTPAIPIELPPNPAPATTTGTLVVPATQTVSYTGAKWRTETSDIIQGEFSGNGNHTGVAFYGSRALGVVGSTITDVKLRMKRKSTGGSPTAQPLTLWLITQNQRPAGAPTRGSSTAGPLLAWGQSTVLTLPNSWGQALVDGTAGGIAVYDADGSPYVVLEGSGKDSSAFTVTLKWTRIN